MSLRLFWCGQFLKSLLNLLQYCLCFIFWFFGLKVCGNLVPWPGIKPAPLIGRQGLNNLDHQGNPPLKCFDILLNSDLSQCSDLGLIDSKGGWGPRERTLRCFSNNSWNYPQVFPLKGPVVIYLSDYTLRKQNSLIFWGLLDTGCELTMVLRSEAIPWPPCWNEGWWGPGDK